MSTFNKGLGGAASRSIRMKGSAAISVLTQNLLWASDNLGITSLRADRSKACQVVFHSQDRLGRDHIHTRKQCTALFFLCLT
ncbi:hypothetical protein D3C81_1948440 [compost metagenome]